MGQARGRDRVPAPGNRPGHASQRGAHSRWRWSAPADLPGPARDGRAWCPDPAVNDHRGHASPV